MSADRRAAARDASTSGVAPGAAATPSATASANPARPASADAAAAAVGAAITDAAATPSQASAGAPDATTGVRELSAQSLDSVSAPEPGPAVAAAPDVAAEPAQTRRPADGAWGLGIALKAALLLPAGRPSDANAIADAAAKAARDFFFSGALALQYALPFHRPLTIGVESGYYRLSGSGGRSFVNDPDFGPELAYQWKMDAVPVLPGLGYELALLPWVRLAPRAGFAAIYVNAQSTYRSGAGVEVSDARQSDWAFGFWLGLEAAFKLGPGSLIGELRYANARTDLGFQKLYGGTTNRDLGDVQGTNVLLGYRLEL